MIGITGESASGKSTICKEIQNVIKRFNMPVTILTTDNYFNDISELIKNSGHLIILEITAMTLTLRTAFSWIF